MLRSKILRVFLLSALILTFSLNTFCAEVDNRNMLKTGISLTEHVSTMFYGTWRVSSKLISTDSPATFRSHNVDIWDLSKNSNTIMLTNPFSGASASVNLTYANNNVIRFTKKTDYDNKILTDIVEITVTNNSFAGTNKIILETLSDVDKTVRKTESATYKLTGDKISGKSIGEVK